jgi:hypothetical protein
LRRNDLGNRNVKLSTCDDVIDHEDCGKRKRSELALLRLLHRHQVDEIAMLPSDGL